LGFDSAPKIDPGGFADFSGAPHFFHILPIFAPLSLPIFSVNQSEKTPWRKRFMHLVLVGIVLTASALLFLMPSSVRRAAPVRLITGSRTKTRRSAEKNGAEGKPVFRGFIIEPGSDCCQASKELQTITFSYRDRISLPLPGCEKKTCVCRKHTVKERRHHERRSRLDRRSELRFSTGAVDRRIKKGRRQQDNLWSGGYVH
jgi:hypothetical protein